VPVTHAILAGETADAICRRVESVGADLVVMTSHGRTGASRAWLGSVADGVIRQSLVPVFVLRATEGTTTQVLPPRLLVLLDGSVYAADVLPMAVHLSTAIGARLSLLRVVEPAAAVAPAGDSRFDFVPPIIDREATRQLADEATAQLANIARSLSDATGADVAFDVVIDANVPQAILDFVHEHDIGVIAMATHGRGLSRVFVGSVADKLMRRSGLPMLIYRPFGPQVHEIAAHGQDVVARQARPSS
jgi:nucleotide-binding universal stress UspA family protein